MCTLHCVWLIENARKHFPTSFSCRIFSTRSLFPTLSANERTFVLFSSFDNRNVLKQNVLLRCTNNTPDKSYESGWRMKWNTKLAANLITIQSEWDTLYKYVSVNLSVESQCYWESSVCDIPTNVEMFILFSFGLIELPKVNLPFCPMLDATNS